MAPSRGRGKTRAAASASSAPSSTRRSTRKAKNALPDVYDDLLAEAAVTDPANEPNRPLKRRRILREVSIPKYEPSGGAKGKQPAPKAPADGGDKDRQGVNVTGPTGRGLQTVEASSDDEDESDFAFEDVDLTRPAATSNVPADEDGIADISISLDSPATRKPRVQARRKPASFAEKAHRLLVHKAHVLCLLGHCIYANSWCNNEVVQRHLEPLVTAKMKTYLHPKTTESQFVRNRSFMDGLQQACEAFRELFEVTASGVRRAQWAGEGGGNGAQPDVEPIDRSDFIKAAKKLQGSQDTGNWLFCAMLRSVGVEARLVCSLQLLPFTSTAAKSSTPQKAVKPRVLAIASDTDPDKSEASADDASVQSSRSIGKVPSVRRRLGQPSFASSPAPSPAPRAKEKAVRTLSYPVYWVEAFNAAQQKWIAVDPVVTGTVNKPSKFEPPSSYEFNQLSYVISFESDGVAKDVTRRYAKAYNAKTRRQRVEATAGGAQWWKKAMRIFRRRGGALDRDQVEDAELAQKEAREGLPGNVQDFKDHPYYALERHVKRHEVLHPRREVGKVNAGTAAKPRMEAVFRRQDVLVCRSADRWYRLGREVKQGEQPLKHVVARSVRRAKSPAGDEDEDALAAGNNTTALYAANQTEIYTPPPIVRGRIPRNAYGNLDIYVPSMVPAGGVHIRHPLTQQAARVLRIDFADAVTGFQFKGRQGTAVVEGAVVAAQYGDAVRAVIDGFEVEKAEEVDRGRSLRALGLWRKFWLGVRIAERVRGYGDASAAKGKEKVRVEMDKVEDEAERVRDAGGFVLEVGGEVEVDVPLLTAGRFSLAELSAPAGKGGSKKRRRVEESDGEGEFVERAESAPNEEMESRALRARPDDEYIGGDDDGEGGGFTLDAEAQGEDGGGGFVPDGEGEDGGGGGGFVSDDAEPVEGDGGGFVADDGDGDGGFIAAYQEADDGGGFLPDALGVEEADLTANDPAGADSHGRSKADNAGSASGMHIRASSPSAYATISTTDGDRDHATAAHGIPELADAVAEGVVSAGDTNAHVDEETENHGDAWGLSVTSGGEAREHAEADMLGVGDLENTAVSKPVDDGDARAARDDSDRGSLLSHDPEDEDAEPDWLESD
ncbi:hypothetical protein LTR36_006517 [Oleoguttula mirabilis]|uniref:Rad4-domain-containing protein n=1 Tax=Oleoguttula mirabilis TaxID=1507867 RepID=A0AAV9JVJ7_9PEZI|nr:hypothetical protein LTR36_006517 [Oleoguttula mirabilis]